MNGRDESTTITARVARLLRERGERVVFAESCTAGWVAALLSAEPGISAHLCGSLVTYRESCKQAWLGVDESALREHTAVSAPVTRQMALGALKRTDEATWAVAVTGHVGPQSPAELDGVCFVAIARRAPGFSDTVSSDTVSSDTGSRDALRSSAAMLVDEARGQLAATSRVERQREAAEWVLHRLAVALDDDAVASESLSR